jgi:hypothetical protein
LLLFVRFPRARGGAERRGESGTSFGPRRRGFSPILPGLGLHLQQSGFDRGGAAEPPSRRRHSHHKFALENRARIAVGDQLGFERLILLTVFEHGNDGVAAQSLTHIVSA